MGETGAGIYLLEEFDPERIPILFVHGLGGTPRDLSELIESVDRSRFQPWLFHYPSGFRLATISTALKRRLAEFCSKLDVQQLFVVAHSMGGLISRDLVLQLEQDTETRGIVDLLLTIASPLEGHSAVRWGLRFAPEPVPSWIDLEPGSDYLVRLKKPLSPDIEYHLLFGFRRGGNLLMSPSSDSVVLVSSQLPQWAQKEAVTVRGFDTDHMEILADPESVELFQRILANAHARSSGKTK